ncbi:MAG: ATP-binding cassette domain-containing protein [Nitrospinota bacterium]
MLQISLQGVCHSFGGPPLLENISFQIHKGEKISLIGRNGSGKSTLLKLIQGEFPHDSGIVRRQSQVSVSTLPQEIPSKTEGTLFNIVAGGLGKRGKLLSEYHKVSSRVENSQTEDVGEELSRIQHALDLSGGWDGQKKVEKILSKMKLDADQEFSVLSTGMKRRTLLARSLVAEPDVLLLDEPTNHLDIDAIVWMENFFSSYQGTVLFVTHDRLFLRKLATRIVELDRGGLYDWSCDYDTFLKRKEALLSDEAKKNALFEKRLAKEEAWIRQGIKARRTRNEGRVTALKKMREERKKRRELTGPASISVQGAQMSGKVVFTAEDICHEFGSKKIVEKFSTVIVRGDKVGLIGPNGAGKTTLLHILLEKIKPTNGCVISGTKLKTAYFDQMRAALDEDKSVRENIGGGSDFIDLDGVPRHVVGYLQDFLFSPDRVMMPVRRLSGGERNRLLLARLFATPSNLLILDEPTNDLDEETLVLLEEKLLEYKGTILLVSHDRAFLNNVVTSTLVFEGGGRVVEYVGGYDDWVRQSADRIKLDTGLSGNTKNREKNKKKGKDSGKTGNHPRKLTFKERRELDSIPQKIEMLEREQGKIYAELANPDFYKNAGKEVSQANSRLQEIEKELKEVYSRWEDLESVKTG